jgi:hypothetical protein
MRAVPFKRLRILLAAMCMAAACVFSSYAVSAQKLVVAPVVQKKVKQLPAGPLFWRVENFPTLQDAQTAAGPTGLAAEAAGKVWLFTLGPKGAASPGGTIVSEIGPIPPVSAPEYLLRINRAEGPSGAQTAVHSHPGSESFYVLRGRLGQRTPNGTAYAEAGHAMVGHLANTPMRVFSAGPDELEQLVMFVVDATKPFSSPAKMP